MPPMRAAHLTAEDERFLAIAEQHRDARKQRPPLSQFCVVAVFAYEDAQGQLEHVVGTNCECAEIGNSLCAERAAVAQLAFRDVRRVRKVYIVSDAAACLTPGTLCREFLSASPLLSLQTPFISRASACAPCETTLQELYPFPSIFRCMPRDELLPFAEAFCRKAATGAALSPDVLLDDINSNNDSQLDDDALTKMLSPFMAAQVREMTQDERDAYIAAHIATANDARDDLFPIRGAAAVLFSDGSRRVAWQHKTLEFGSSLDAVSKLIPFIEDVMSSSRGAIRPTTLLHLDQFGILHAPSARARAYLYEFDLRDVCVLVHDAAARLHRVPVEHLVFHSPDCIADTTCLCS